MRGVCAILAATIAAFSSAAAQPGAAQHGATQPGAASTVELAAPRTLRAGDSVAIEITTAGLPPGARLTLTTGAGEVLGAVAPFPRTAPVSTAAVPVPLTALQDGRLTLRLQVIEPGGIRRPPLEGEVRSLDLVAVPGG